MDKLRAMAGFVRIVDEGSLTAAPRALGVSLPALVNPSGAAAAQRGRSDRPGRVLQRLLSLLPDRAEDRAPLCGLPKGRGRGQLYAVSRGDRRGRRENVPAPQLAIDYWNLGKDATLRDLVVAVRNDEAKHSAVNHGLADEMKHQQGEGAINEQSRRVRTENESEAGRVER